jgi:hypothetical protein
MEKKKMKRESNKEVLDYLIGSNVSKLKMLDLGKYIHDNSKYKISNQGWESKSKEDLVNSLIDVPKDVLLINVHKVLGQNAHGLAIDHLTKNVSSPKKIIQDPREKKAWAFVEKFCTKFGLDIDILRIKHWDKNSAEYNPRGSNSGIISLDLKSNIDEIKEDLYHEIGHAIDHQYGLPDKLLKLFEKKSPKLKERISQKRMDTDIPPPEGFVTWYATTDGTEDFCECLSAWASNNYKTTGKITYGGYTHSLDKEKDLAFKIKQIASVLGEMGG